jgi:DNA sulfur modification protein DndD
MLFRSIQIHNFLSFKGTNTFDFPAPDKSEHSLLLVLAANTAGKTNTIRALRFLFCGDMLGHRDDAHKLINDAAAAEAATGQSVEGWVQAHLIYRGRERTIRRRITAKGQKAGALSGGVTVLEERKHERKGDVFVTDQGEIQRVLSLMVPPELFNYFFFEGETLANDLLGGHSNKGIREGLATLIHEHEWEDAIETVQAVQKDITKQLSALGKENAEYNSVLNELQTKKDLLEKELKRRGEFETQAADAKKAYEDCEEQIRNLSNGKPFDDLNKKLSNARAELKAKERDLDSAEREIAAEVGSSHGLPLLEAAFKPAFTQLEEMRGQNLLPGDVSEPFVHRLLEAELCVCGRSLDPGRDATERRCVEDYLKRTMAVDLSALLMGLLNALEPGSKKGFVSRTKESRAALSKALDERDANIVAIADLKTRVQGLEKERDRLNVTEIQRLQAEQRKAADKEIEANRHIKGCDSVIRVLEHDYSQKEAELKKIGRKGAGAEILSLTQTRRRADELATFIGEARAAVKASFHKQLQNSLANYYDPVAPDNSTAWVDPKSLLPAIKVDGEIRKNIGGAQRQLLVLGHIVSLAQLRKWLHEQLQQVGVNPGQIEDHCFVLDSVFGPAADQFREKCAEFLVGKARQIVVLVASQQWDDIVRSRLEKPVTKAYRLVRHTPKDDISPSERLMRFRSKDYEVFHVIPAGKKAYTVAEEISK